MTGCVKLISQIKVIATLTYTLKYPVENQSKDVEEILQSMHVAEEPRGQYKISYSPQRKGDHSLSIYWKGIKVSHKEIEVLLNMHEYDILKQEVKIIDKYGPTSKQVELPYLLAKGPDNELIVCDNSTNQLVVFDKYLQFSHVIGGTGRGNG